MNICLQALLCFYFLAIYPEGILQSYVYFNVEHFKELKTSTKRLHHFTFTPVVYKGSDFLHILQLLSLSISLIIVIQSAKWYLMVILIFLMTNNGEHLYFSDA